MRRARTYLLAIAVALSAGGHSVSQEALSAEQIVRSLMPQKATRDLRGVTVEPGAEPQTPSVSMRVQFAYDSSELEMEAQLSLKALGLALSDPRLANETFTIIGHTDASGSAEYNAGLSARRAASVVDHLVFYYGIDKSRLQPIGMGEQDLLNEAFPEADENRRVEIRTTLP